MEWVALIILMSMISLAGWWLVFGSKRSQAVPPDEQIAFLDADEAEDGDGDPDFDD